MGSVLLSAVLACVTAPTAPQNCPGCVGTPDDPATSTARCVAAGRCLVGDGAVYYPWWSAPHTAGLTGQPHCRMSGALHVMPGPAPWARAAVAAALPVPADRLFGKSVRRARSR